MSLTLGIDLGGTSAKLALVSKDLKIIKQDQFSSSGKPKPKVLVDRLAAAARELTKAHTITRIGVGVAGDLDYEKGVIRYSPNLGWIRVPLRKMLVERLKKNVIVDNDANVAAWGIYKTQVKAEVKNLIVVTLGTGVGGGIILDGKIHHGATGSAGEIGHMIMTEHGRRCNCGNYGCLEAYVGGHYLTLEVKRALSEGKESSLQKIYAKDPNDVTPFTIAQAANGGDEFALSMWNDVGRVLGIALGNLVYTFNPEVIFLTGGIAQAGNLILDPVWRKLRERAFKVPIGKVKIKIPKKAAHIGVIGASLL